MRLGDALLEVAPRAFPGWYQKLADHVLEPAHRAVAEEAGRRFPRSRILDFGTGPGTWPVRLLKIAAEAEVDAVDVSDHLLIRAEDNARLAGFRSRIRHGLVERGRFPWPERRYDLVVCQFVIGESEPAAAAAILLQIHDLLEPGGECWQIDAHLDATIGDETIVAELRGKGVLSKWIPLRWQVEVVRALRARRLGEEEILRLAEQSPFGGAQEQCRLPLQFGSTLAPGAATWLSLRKADLVVHAR